MTPVHTRSCPQGGQRAGGASPRWAPTVCQARRTGMTTGGLSERPAPQRPGLGSHGLVPPVRPDHPGLWPRDRLEPALEPVRHGHGHPLGRGAATCGLHLAGAMPAGAVGAVPGHAARLFARTTPQSARQLGHDTCPVTRALHEPPVPLRLRRGAEAVHEGDQGLRAHRLGEDPRPTGAGLAQRVHQLAPQDRHHHTGREEKPVAHHAPLSRRAQPTPRDATRQMGRHQQGLTPGVQRGDHPRLAPQRRGSRQPGGQGVAHGLH